MKRLGGFASLVLVCLVPAGAAFGGSARVGSEFQINTYTTGIQAGTNARAVARAGNGDFVVVWSDSGYFADGKDGDGLGIFGQRFSAAGAPLGSEFQVNTYTTYSQHRPAVVMAEDGSFVIVWQSGDQFESQDGSDAGVFGQRFDSAGLPEGTEFQINTYALFGQRSPDVAAADDGRFAVVWVDDGYELNGRDKSGSGIYARRYDAEGDPQDDQFRVNSYTKFDQDAPAVAATNDFEIVVTWQSKTQDGGGTGVFAQLYDDSGEGIGDEFQVNAYTNSTQGNPDVDFGASLVVAPQDSFVVVWESLGQDGSQSGIFGQRFAGTGGVIGTEFRVNAQTAAAQTGPAIARDDSGEFIVVWESVNQDGSGPGIFGRGFNLSAIADGGDFQVNAFTAGSQFDATPLPADTAGNFAVVWVSDDQDGNHEGMIGQRFCKDADNDTVCNPVDVCAGANDLVDADGDSVPDGCDDCPGFDDALDADGDQVPDDCDVCPGFDDDIDPDNDDIPTGCDLCPADVANDVDGDGYCRNTGFLPPKLGGNDNCPTTANPSQADGDGDGAGDDCDLCLGFNDSVNPDNDSMPTGCDPCPADQANDVDGDGYCRNTGFLPPKIGDNDNCPTDANPLQENADGDSKGDACDSCPTDNPDDNDNDTVCNSVDLCVNDSANDADGDGYCANSGFLAPKVGDNDNCPVDTNASQTDGDGDGQGNVCDICTNVANQQEIDGRLVVSLQDISEAPVADNDDRMLISGEMKLPMTSMFATTVDPIHDPIHLAIDTQSGQRKVDITLPDNASGGADIPGWSLTASGTKWIFRDRFGTATMAEGISAIVLKDRSDLEAGLIKFKIRASGGNYPLLEADVPVTVRLRVGSGIAECGEKSFAAEQCVFDSERHTLRCAL